MASGTEHVRAHPWSAAATMPVTSVGFLPSDGGVTVIGQLACASVPPNFRAADAPLGERRAI